MRTAQPPSASVGPRPARRTLTSVVLLTLLAWVQPLLEADVIDDFSGPKKFEAIASVGVIEYEINGELHWVLPSPGEFGVFAYRPVNYELPEGQPIEFRMDIVSLGHADAGAGLAVFFPGLRTDPRGGGRAYTAWWLPESVIFTKACSPLDGRAFDTAHESSFEPVTLSLTLTRQGSSLKLGTKAVRRGEPEHVLFSREVTDRPGVDFAEDSGVPHGGPVMTVGMYVASTSGSLGADGVFDNLVCSADPTPAAPVTLGLQRHTETQVSLQWPNVGILLEADALAGPWKPWPSVPSESGLACLAVIGCGGPARFYRVAEGVQMLDRFDTQWSLLPRLIASPVPGQSEVPGFTVPGGRGRIRGTGPRNSDFLLHYGHRFGTLLSGDVLASVDLVDWDSTMEDAAFGIVLRANPGTELWHPATDGLPHDRYAGSLTFKQAGEPAESVLSLTGPGGEVLASAPFPAVDPAKQYRLRFGALGDRLTLELFSLDNLGNETLVQACAATDGRVVAGGDALFGTKSSGDTYDVTVDRYLFTEVAR